MEANCVLLNEELIGLEVVNLVFYLKVQVILVVVKDVVVTNKEVIKNLVPVAFIIYHIYEMVKISEKIIISTYRRGDIDRYRLVRNRGDGLFH